MAIEGLFEQFGGHKFAVRSLIDAKIVVKFPLAHTIVVAPPLISFGLDVIGGVL
jgi:hypothetical protein